jgi:hypothetical protein
MSFSEAAELDETTDLQNRIRAASPFDRFVRQNWAFGDNKQCNTS